MKFEILYSKSITDCVLEKQNMKLQILYSKSITDRVGWDTIFAPLGPQNRPETVFWKKNMKFEILYSKSITDCVLEKQNMKLQILYSKSITDRVGWDTIFAPLGPQNRPETVLRLPGYKIDTFLKLFY